MKKLISLLLAAGMALSPAVPAFAADTGRFQRVNAYTAGQFTDVASPSWYEENVRAVYEYVLMT